jgi:thiamine kinase-like enzyme
MKALEQLVRDAVQMPAGAEIHHRRMKSDVYRCTVTGSARSFVAKRLDPDIARRNELVARRWLPAAGLSDCGPPLLATAAERDGSSIWHLYADLGDCGLDVAQAGPGAVESAIATIARIHTAFAGHPLIPEFRNWGGDLGIHFYATSVRDAMHSIESLRTRRRLDAGRAELCERLLARLANLHREQDERAQLLHRQGGPETLLHGDLWPMNVMVHDGDGDAHVRLIDWDHAAVGPISYDLSTFLSRVPDHDRSAILRIYAEHIAGAGWELPAVPDLNLLFETAELGRIANRVIWPALAAREQDAGWAYAELGEVERWFAQLEPVLSTDDACARS